MDETKVANYGKETVLANLMQRNLKLLLFKIN